MSEGRTMPADGTMAAGLMNGIRAGYRSRLLPGYAAKEMET
jgi:hypothetical protein